MVLSNTAIPIEYGAFRDAVLRGEKMEGYELYRLSDEEIQHSGVKGMKWGKRKAYMDAVNAHEKKGQDIRDTKSNEKRLKKQISEAKKKNLTPEERKARNVKIAKVTAGVAITAGVVVGAAYIYKYKHLPAKAANDQAKARVLEAMKRNMEKSVAESLKNTNVDRAAQTIRKQAASKVASAVTLGKSSKGNTLDDILKQTEHFADLMNKGTLSAGQSASWQALNEEMIEIFKQTNNPYM